MASAENIEQYLKGNFITRKNELQQKLQQIKAFIFDWDGVFNNAHKSLEGNSTFSETDSMGVNLMRFNHFMQTNTQPFTAIITGENNQCAFSFAKRERFNAVYYKIKHKETALKHFCEQYNLKPSEVMFVFDDVLDFSAAKLVGVRVMVNHPCNPLLTEFAIDNRLVDYLTQHEGSNGAVRETTELVMCLSNRYAETIQNRMEYNDTYQTYIDNRNDTITEYFTIVNHEITEQFSR